MSRADAMRVAILAHSTNPRGGVVHALELGDALVRLGHEAIVHAPDAKGGGFFRSTLCGSALVPASPVEANVATLVETRIAEYLSYFENPANRRFDVFHAQDGISGNALATLKERGLVRCFARTVHHIDDFEDERVAALQARSILAADQLFVVSRTWREILGKRFGRSATIVGNGVDGARFCPVPNGREEALRARLGLSEGPIFLSIGGVEERKNTLRLLEAFREVRRVRPAAQLLIAGGASLLDHSAYQRRFAATLAANGASDWGRHCDWAAASRRYAGSLSPGERSCFSFDQGRLRTGGHRGDGVRRSGRGFKDRAFHRISRRRRRHLVRSVQRRDHRRRDADRERGADAEPTCPPRLARRRASRLGTRPLRRICRSYVKLSEPVDA